MDRYVSLFALQPTTYRRCSKKGQESARGRRRIKKYVRKQERHGTQPGAVWTSHQHRQIRAHSHACVRVHVHGASRARDSGRPVSRRLVATVSSSAWQPRQPSYMFYYFESGDYAENQTSGTGTHRSSSRRSSSDSSGMVLLKIAPRSKSPLARWYRS
jgi:hypothetical protein